MRWTAIKFWGRLLTTGKCMAGQVILAVAYGVEVRPEGDPFVNDAENMLHALALGTTKEASLFDTIPWCICCCLRPDNKRFTDEFTVIHMPSWFPGATLQALCARVVPHCRECSAESI